MKALLLRNFDGKMTIGKKIAGIILVFFPVLVYAQSDSLFSFSEKQFLQAVRQFHPIVKQSNNKLEMAKAGIVAARAGFDPQFLHEMDEKKLGGDWYYQIQHQELILPTWYGIDFTAGRESIVGPRYNPENSLGDYSYLSVKIPLLKDLVMDKRRAALKQSKIFLQQSEQEQKNMVNDLMNDAFQTYWNWKRSYQQWLISKSVNENNRLRFEFVKQEYLQGFRAAIDTLEALIQWQQWQSHQIESELLFKNANVELSAFLWDQNAQPYQLPDKTIPDKLTMGTNEMPIPVLEELMLYVENSHPKLMTYKFKSTSLELDRLLKKQELLPKLNLKAQL